MSALTLQLFGKIEVTSGRGLRAPVPARGIVERTGPRRRVGGAALDGRIRKTPLEPRYSSSRTKIAAFFDYFADASQVAPTSSSAAGSLFIWNRHELGPVADLLGPNEKRRPGVTERRFLVRVARGALGALARQRSSNPSPKWRRPP